MLLLFLEQVRELEKALEALFELTAESALATAQLHAYPPVTPSLDEIWKITNPSQGSQTQAALDAACQQLAAHHGRMAGEIEDRTQLARLLQALTERQSFAINTAKADLVVRWKRLCPCFASLFCLASAFALCFSALALLLCSAF